MSSAVELCRKAFAEGLELDPDLPPSDWANGYRVLSQKGAAEPGPYRIERTPYLKEILDNLGPKSPVQRVVFMKSAQIGASEAGFNWLGYIIHLNPGPTLMVQPTEQMAERVSKQRIAPMIDETPVLRERISPVKAKDSGNTLLMKEFKGGVLIMAGANSPSGLASMPIKNLMFDELDRAPKSAGSEGSPLALAEKRTETFPVRRKIFIPSTPTTKGESAVELEFEQTDQRRYFLPCPHCGHEQHLRWANLKWTEEDPNSAAYMCESCGVLIEEHHKREMLAAGRWVPTAPSKDPLAVGYHINALYSPWAKWRELVKQFLKAKNDRELLKVFVNTVLGETFEEDIAAKVGADALMARAEFYETNVVPEKASILVAGIDVQDNRVAVKVVAYGDGEEAWVMSYQEVFGDPAQTAIWRQVDEVVLRQWKHAGGSMMPVSAIAIDSGGHYTAEVYQYARERRGKNVIAIRGASQKGKPPISKPTKVDLNFRGQSLKNGAEVYIVGTDTVKTTLYGRFKITEPGAGYVHFHTDLGHEYFKMLTSERKQVRYVKGFPTTEWVKQPGSRNESLDCMVYAYAALQWLYTRYNRASIFAQFEKRLGIKKDETTENKPDEKGNSGEQAAVLQNQDSTRRIRPMQKRKGFVSSW